MLKQYFWSAAVCLHFFDNAQSVRVQSDLGPYCLQYSTYRVRTGKYEQNSRTFQGLLKASPTVFKDLMLMKNTDLSVRSLLQKCKTAIIKTLVLEN